MVQGHIPVFAHRAGLPAVAVPVPRQALRGDIQKSIFKDISGNRGTSAKSFKKRTNGSKNAPEIPPEGPSVVSLPVGTLYLGSTTQAPPLLLRLL